MINNNPTGLKTGQQTFERPCWPFFMPSKKIIIRTLNFFSQEARVMGVFTQEFRFKWLITQGTAPCQTTRGRPVNMMATGYMWICALKSF